MSSYALGLSAIPGAAFGVAQGNSSSLPFDKVVYDERFEDCRSFGSQASKLGADTCAIQGDVFELWYEGLRNDLSENPRVIAGLTTENSSFLLQMLGHDVFYHQVFRGEHQFRGDQIIGHRFEIPEYLSSSAAKISHRSESLSIELVELLAKYHRQNSKTSKSIVEAEAIEQATTQKLVSWIIAPIYRDNEQRI